jgi:hypothetical protein
MMKRSSCQGCRTDLISLRMLCENIKHRGSVGSCQPSPKGIAWVWQRSLLQQLAVRLNFLTVRHRGLLSMPPPARTHAIGKRGFFHEKVMDVVSRTPSLHRGPVLLATQRLCTHRTRIISAQHRSCLAHESTNPHFSTRTNPRRTEPR